MSNSALNRSALVVCLSVFAVGTIFGVSGAYFLDLMRGNEAEFPFEIPLHATATHGQDNYAIATGPIDENVEGLYFLDALTGELKGAGINIRTGKYQAFFSRNVMQDFFSGGRQAKNPRFLIVTGQADLQTTAGRVRFAQSAIYVAELTTGQVAAYAIQYPPNLWSTKQTYQAEFTPLDKVELRKTRVRTPG